MKLNSLSCCALLVLLGSVLFLAPIGTRDLWAPDEPRYGAIAEEVRNSDEGWRGLVLLKLNGMPYTQKPPLYFWLAALVGSPSGHVGEVAVRLPSALAGIACLLLLFRFGSELFDRRIGFAAAVILMTMFRFSRTAQRAQLDTLLTFFQLAALYAFWHAQKENSDSRKAIVGAHVAMGFAVLTKGPVGFLIPLLSLGGFLAFQNRIREIVKQFHPGLLLISLGPTVLWFWAATTIAPSGYFAEAFVDNVVGRFFSGTSHVRPIYYYLYDLPINTLPWSVVGFLLGGIVWKCKLWNQLGHRDTSIVFVIAAVLAPLLFFSVSSGKRGIYMLPCYPALALLIAWAFFETVSRRKEIKWILLCSFVLSCLLALLGLLGATAVLSGATTYIPLAFCFSLVFVGAVGLGLFWAKPNSALCAGISIAIMSYGTFCSAFMILNPYLNSEKSPRLIAEAAADNLGEEEPIGLLFHRSLIGGLSYYSKRDVRLLNKEHLIEEFLDDGGRIFVCRTGSSTPDLPANEFGFDSKKRRLCGEINRYGETAVLASFRSGKREVQVLELIKRKTCRNADPLLETRCASPQ